jgi:hypothetical protein
MLLAMDASNQFIFHTGDWDAGRYEKPYRGKPIPPPSRDEDETLTASAARARSNFIPIE